MPKNIYNNIFTILEQCKWPYLHDCPRQTIYYSSHQLQCIHKRIFSMLRGSSWCSGSCWQAAEVTLGEASCGVAGCDSQVRHPPLNSSLVEVETLWQSNIAFLQTVHPRQWTCRHRSYQINRVGLHIYCADNSWHKNRKR